MMNHMMSAFLEADFLSEIVVSTGRNSLKNTYMWVQCEQNSFLKLFPPENMVSKRGKVALKTWC